MFLEIYFRLFLQNLLCLWLDSRSLRETWDSFQPFQSGVFGTVLGAFPWYYLGKAVSEERLEHLADKYGKWITVSSKDIKKANNWFSRHGVKAVFFGRLVPGVRTLISLPAGINDMSLIPFVLYSTIGTSLWVIFLTTLGYLLGDNYELVDEYLGPVSKNCSTKSGYLVYYLDSQKNAIVVTSKYLWLRII